KRTEKGRGITVVTGLGMSKGNPHQARAWDSTAVADNSSGEVNFERTAVIGQVLDPVAGHVSWAMLGSAVFTAGVFPRASGQRACGDRRDGEVFCDPCRILLQIPVRRGFAEPPGGVQESFGVKRVNRRKGLQNPNS